MQSIQANAVKSLADMENNYHQNDYQPLKSSIFQNKCKSNSKQIRPKTANNLLKKQSISVDNKNNKIEELKKQLRFLEDLDEEQIPNSFKQCKKYISTQSVFCMKPTNIADNFNGFPIRLTKKQSVDQPLIIMAKTKQNENISPQYQRDNFIRLNIKNTFNVKPSLRKRINNTKRNSLLKIPVYSQKTSDEDSGFFRKLEGKRLRQTFVNILS